MRAATSKATASSSTTPASPARRSPITSSGSPDTPMLRRLTIAAITLLVCAGFLRADDTATPFFMELQPNEILPHAVGGNGWVSVGALMNGGGFYWMPNTGKVELGGTSAAAISRDGQR